MLLNDFTEKKKYQREKNYDVICGSTGGVKKFD